MFYFELLKGACECLVEFDGSSTGLIFDEATEACVCEVTPEFMNIDADGVCVPKTAEELKVELDVFQMCVANFAEFNLELDAEVQVAFYQALFSLDFTTIEIGGLASIFTADFKAIVPAEVDFSILVTSDTFITLNTLIDVLFVMEARGLFNSMLENSIKFF